MKQYDALLYIGRFQPFHNGHAACILRALELADHCRIVVGSANVCRSPRNPFTLDERFSMIRWSLAEAGLPMDRISFIAIDDFPYNDGAWVAAMQDLIAEAQEKNGPLVGIIGFDKDDSTRWLRKFPGIECEIIPSQWGNLDATSIREAFFDPKRMTLPDTMLVPDAVRTFLRGFYLTQEYKWLAEEYSFYANYDASKFPIFIVTVDAVVVQSGHVLLVERKHNPGRGLLALPGGHVNIDETLDAAVARELREETKIHDAMGPMPPAGILSYTRKKRVFDSPRRSQRGRVITHAYLFQFPERKDLFKVEGSDDAASASWHKLGTLDPLEFFEDHYFIISAMTEGAVA